jgi:zinc transport system substrate-binding protein
MVEAIGGEFIDLTVMVPPGSEPHDYEPLPSQLMAVSEADVYFAVGSGVEFELQNLDFLSDQNDDMLVVNCSEDIELKRFDEHYRGNVTDGFQLSGAIDPHVWTSPSNLLIMASNVLDGLITTDPSHEDEYRQNYDQYIDELQGTADEIDGTLASYRDMAFLVYHPAWGYFGDEYGLVMLAIEEEGTQPGPAGVAAIIEQANENGIDVIFVSPQFDSSSAEQIAEEIGGEVIIIDPLAEDLLDELLAAAEQMAEGFS